MTRILILSIGLTLLTACSQEQPMVDVQLKPTVSKVRECSTSTGMIIRLDRNGDLKEVNTEGKSYVWSREHLMDGTQIVKRRICDPSIVHTVTHDYDRIMMPVVTFDSRMANDPEFKASVVRFEYQ